MIAAQNLNCERKMPPNEYQGCQRYQHPRDSIRRDIGERMCYNVHIGSEERDMGASTTMTIRVTPNLKEKLGRLAENTRRTKSYLAAAAVEAYVDRELQIIEGIQRGIADMEADRVTPHKEAMDRIDAAIAAAGNDAA